MKGKDLMDAIFNRSRDKGGIISNARKVTTDKHLIMGGRGALGFQMLIDQSSVFLVSVTTLVGTCMPLA